MLFRDTALLAKSDEPISPNSLVTLPVEEGILRLSHQLLGNSVLIFQNTGCYEVILRSCKNPYTVKLSFEDFPNFALWTFATKRAGYLCIEPWHGLPCLTTDTNALADKLSCILLDPGAQKELGYSVSFHNE